MEQSISFLTAGFIWSAILMLVIWSVVWKAVALWHAAKRGEKIWFIALMFINTAGLLEIIYLALVAKIWSQKIIPVVPPSPTAPVAPTSAPATPVTTPAPTTPAPVPEVSQSNLTNQ
ncbi:MAG: hypothetical protein A2571_00925 [Candidatus Vogelbacteria bacterium RIFOXYD1_FULL_44_32]|uniref:DUF5652 domain-containing protein n=1 Tax=Candidatus Vogelbacteria bacterium RIFOXYD1_FULL_44_32 TaxID=1802438 RepID=A0A1G2QEB5_9BACT|nr:MAG: hypothetical protein A2571_00925 [Candidatus Vogelbacteria bacterium RIFOXYD1_FULL_44_32]